MNTSNVEPTQFAQQGFTENGGLPDIAQLTKLANELFTALPCDGSRLGQASTLIASGLTSPLASAASAQDFALPGDAELNTFFANSSSPYQSVQDSLDTGSVYGNNSPNTNTSLAAFDKSVLAGILPNDFGLPDEAQLQQLLVSRAPTGSNLHSFDSAEKLPAVAALNPSITPQVSDAHLQKLFAESAPVTEIPSRVAGAPESDHVFSGFDANLIAGLSPKAYGLPGEAELQQLFVPAPKVPVSASSSPSFYFLDELKSDGFNAPALNSAHPPFDVQAVRRDFPILKERVNGHPLVWFDNAATTQKPQSVIDRVSYFYEHENSNIHRAAHELAARSTDAYEKARDTVAHFMNASSSSEIVFARGTTEAINLVAKSWGQQNIKAGDEIVITWLEHHANIVPWKQLCDLTGAILRVVPVDEDDQV